MFKSREQVSCIYFVYGGIDSTYKVQTYTSDVTCDAYSWCSPVSSTCLHFMCMNVELVLYCHVCLHVCIIYSTYDTIGGSSMQLP